MEIGWIIRFPASSKSFGIGNNSSFSFSKWIYRSFRWKIVNFTSAVLFISFRCYITIQFVSYTRFNRVAIRKLPTESRLLLYHNPTTRMCPRCGSAIKQNWGCNRHLIWCFVCIHRLRDEHKKPMKREGKGRQSMNIKFPWDLLIVTMDAKKKTWQPAQRLLCSMINLPLLFDGHDPASSQRNLLLLQNHQIAFAVWFPTGIYDLICTCIASHRIETVQFVLTFSARYSCRCIIYEINQREKISERLMYRTLCVSRQCT